MSVGSAKSEIVSDGEENKCCEIDALADDYAAYLHADGLVQTQQFDDSIEELLTKLDEYHSLLDMIRSDTTLCLQKNIPLIRAKTKDMEKIFDRIDKLEVFVSMVKKNMSVIEEKVSRAEADLSPLEGFRKVFSAFPMPSFLAPKSPPAKQLPKYETPDIYRTEDFITHSSNGQKDSKLLTSECVLSESQLVQSGSSTKSAELSSGISSAATGRQVNTSEMESSKQAETECDKEIENAPAGQKETASKGKKETTSKRQKETTSKRQKETAFPEQVESATTRQTGASKQSETVPNFQVEGLPGNQNEINSISKKQTTGTLEPNLPVQDKCKMKNENVQS